MEEEEWRIYAAVLTADSEGRRLRRPEDEEACMALTAGCHAHNEQLLRESDTGGHKRKH